jgi:hypothetical protein
MTRKWEGNAYNGHSLKDKLWHKMLWRSQTLPLWILFWWSIRVPWNLSGGLWYKRQATEEYQTPYGRTRCLTTCSRSYRKTCSRRY